MTSQNEGTFNVQCKAKSLFWSLTYNYPNSTVVPTFPSSTSSTVEQYTGNYSLVVMNAGLIPAMFGVNQVSVY